MKRRCVLVLDCFTCLSLAAADESRVQFQMMSQIKIQKVALQAKATPAEAHRYELSHERVHARALASERGRARDQSG